MRSFREVGWVIAVAGTTLGCYMVNLRVASERAALEEVSNRIVFAQRDIRVLETEIGTRGRLEQLESWNVRVLALSAPQAHQFLEGGYQLATLTAPRKTVDPAAPVVLAAAPVVQDRQSDAGQEGASARDMMHVASLTRADPAKPTEKAVDKAVAPVEGAVKPASKPAKPAAASAREGKAGTVTAPASKAAAKPDGKSKPAPADNSQAKTKDAQARR
jgi:hypothetical protein